MKLGMNLLLIPLAPELNPHPLFTLMAIRPFKGLTVRHIYMSFGAKGLRPCSNTNVAFVQTLKCDIIAT